MEDLRADHIRHIYFSTSYVFDGEQGNYSEDAPCRPLNLYGRQNREIELWMEEHEPDSLVLRLDKIVGTDPREAHLFSQWQRLVDDGRPIVCMRGMVFSPTLVDDVAEGILRACRLGLRGLYHLAPDESHRREDLARRFLTVTNSHTDILVQAPEALDLIEPRPPRTHLDGTRFRRVTGHSCTRMEAALAIFTQRQGAPVDERYMPAGET
jgi:dTDP-4-dehydrorhamnose reductase